MNHGLVITLLVSGIVYGTPLLIAALGETLAERAGVLNLGVEGMMLVGAVTAFWVSQQVGGELAVLVAIVAAGAAGALMAVIHAFMTMTMRANQTVSGLALTIVGTGLSSYLGVLGNLGGASGRHTLATYDVLGLKDAPIVGPLLFHESALVYFSWVLTAAVAVYLYKTRAGLHLRAVGEEPKAADAMGVNVMRYRYLHTVVGGTLAGVAGSVFTLSITASWTPGMTAGAGWIALGLVIFGFWNPGLILIGAYLFGVVSSLGLNLQARGVKLPPELFSSLPYLMTIVVLVVVSTALAKRRVGAPKALGTAYAREES